MRVGVLAVALVSQLAVSSVGAMDVGGLALPAKVPTFATVGARVLGTFATGAAVLRRGGVLSE